MPRLNLVSLCLSLTSAACASSPKEEVQKPSLMPPAEMSHVDMMLISESAIEVPVSPEAPAWEIEYIDLDRVSQTAVMPPKKYPPLIYGEPKPLVCSHEYPSLGVLAERPNLQLMWEHYLYERPERVWEEVGGAVEYNGCLPEDKGGWRNACTVRLSHMLNKAGHKVPYIKGQTISGENRDQYFFRLDDAQAYIFKTFGNPDLTIDMPGQLFDLPTEPGLFIIKFPGSNFTGHATIWNGAGTVDGVDIVGYEIFFWKLPCFIPSERKN